MTAVEYVGLGFHHILQGVDHLLFVLGLLLIVKGRWMLLKTITAFTAAHSITLAIATLGYASAPLPPLNAAIALSILFLGPELVRSCRGETSLTISYPWVVAFLFGLLHGFGFASGLTTTGMPKAELPPALLFFNGGVELGQLVFVFTALALVKSWQVLEVRWPRWDDAKNQSSYLTWKENVPQKDVAHVLRHEYLCSEERGDKLSGAWGRHPLMGRMYLPAYRAGTELVARVRREHPPARAIPALYSCEGLVDVVTVQQALGSRPA